MEPLTLLCILVICGAILEIIQSVILMALLKQEIEARDWIIKRSERSKRNGTS